MTRQGEFPTNPEMLADLNATAAQAFTNACQRTLDSPHMPRSFEDKPLSALVLSFVRGEPQRLHGPPVVVAEELGIRTINDGDMEFLDRRRSFKDFPQDVKERYQTIADGLANIALSARFQVSEILPMEAVQTDYTIYRSNGTTNEVTTFDSRPLKRTIASGQLFAEAALRYTQSDGFERPPLRPAIPMGPNERIVFYGEGYAEPAGGDIAHHFGLDVSTPYLPLNGFESREFLHDYRQTMIGAYRKRQERLGMIEGMGGFEEHYDRIRQGIAPYENAIKRVEDVLERKNN